MVVKFCSTSCSCMCNLLRCKSSSHIILQRVDLTQQAEVKDRFLPHDTTEAGQVQVGDSSKAGGVCMKMLGSIGGQWPTPQASH